MSEKIDFKTFAMLSLQELYTILKLRTDVFVVEQNCAYAELDNQDQDAIHLLLRKNERLIGYARILFEKGDLHIGRIVVCPSERGQQIGKRIMQSAIDYCHTNYPKHNIYLSAQAGLEHYYQSFGFKTTSSPYNWDGILHVDMVMEC